MARTTHTCGGCGEVLRSRRDLAKQAGTVHASWHCGTCGTSVPGTVAEKLIHQRQHGGSGSRKRL